eukprot:gb/GECG01006601.1/.p1 GENE.gb/GECG01006601.1/~~gb/GECG01006601.1/.p1  ORF type:complete len:142 (+),score=14.15 gb/GECG01006601.1/:1-426(+)
MLLNNRQLMNVVTISTPSLRWGALKNALFPRTIKCAAGTGIVLTTSLLRELIVFATRTIVAMIAVSGEQVGVLEVCIMYFVRLSAAAKKVTDSHSSAAAVGAVFGGIFTGLFAIAGFWYYKHRWVSGASSYQNKDGEEGFY